jgi:metal-sulfur cluster biosynthetic enzyme
MFLSRLARYTQNFGRRDDDRQSRYTRHMALTQEEVLTALKDCYDPEIPVNIVDLGLVYSVSITPTEVPGASGEDVKVDMTLTSPGCPSHGDISQSVQRRLFQLPGIADVKVEMIWEPAWSPQRISPEARKQLGIE